MGDEAVYKEGGLSIVRSSTNASSDKKREAKVRVFQTKPRLVILHHLCWYRISAGIPRRQFTKEWF